MFLLLCVFYQGQPPPAGPEAEKEGEQTDDKKQKENTAYAKKMVLRLAGLMGLGGAVSVIYIFGERVINVAEEKKPKRGAAELGSDSRPIK